MTTPTIKRQRPLTKKQTAFRDAILSGFNPSDAYRKAYDAKAMSKKCISVKAAELLRHKSVAVAISVAVNGGHVPAIAPTLLSGVRLSMEERLNELQCAARLDPVECFDDLNHFKTIRDMPEHVRRAIASFEVDPVSFVTKVRFVDKLSAILTYSKLAGDIPKEKGPGPAPRRAQFDLSKLSDEELKEHMRLRRKALVQIEDQTP